MGKSKGAEGAPGIELNLKRSAVIFPEDDDRIKSEIINSLIEEHAFDKNLISDGYHTFGELYDHRITLWVALCRLIAHSPAYQLNFPVWRSKLHSDGSSYKGWFILGLNPDAGRQISYHLPMSAWEKTWFADTYEKAPEFDGHTSSDVLDRICNLI